MLSNINIPARPILLITPQHSGTYFLEALLADHPEINGRVRLEAAETTHDYLARVRRDLQNHNNRSGVVTFHSHIFDCGHLMFLATLIPTILTVRDPLLSLITCYTRESPGQKNIFTGKRYGVQLIERHAEFIKTINALGEPDYTLPVDLVAKHGPGGRRTIIGDMLKAVGLKSYKNMIEKWGNDWKVVRSLNRRHHNVKEAYERGDAKAVQKLLPDEYWGALQDNKNVLRSYLEKYGYRNLMWW